MNRIKNAFNAIRMLGVFGFILVSAVIIIGLSIFNIFLIDQGISAIHTRSEERFALENVTYYLLEAELAERKYLLHDGSPAAEQAFDEAGASAQAALLALSALTDNQAEIAELQAHYVRTQQDFEEIKAIFAAGLAAEAEHLDQVLRAEGEMEQQMEDLVFNAEVALEEKVQQTSSDVQWSVLVGLVGLVLFPLLAVWAFLVASRITQPLLSLSNAVMAAGGGHYRQDLLDEHLDRHDSLGTLARNVDEMAEALSARESALRQEVENLRKQLHETQRRKLVLSAQVRREVEADQPGLPGGAA